MLYSASHSFQQKNRHISILLDHVTIGHSKESWFAIQWWALFKDSSSFSFHFLSYRSKWPLQLSTQNKFELYSNFLSKQQKLLLPQSQIIFAFRVSISSSKCLIFNFYSTQGNSDFILYDNVIYRIYHNVIFKWNWCDGAVILLYQPIIKRRCRYRNRRKVSGGSATTSIV